MNFHVRGLDNQDEKVRGKTGRETLCTLLINYLQVFLQETFPLEFSKEFYYYYWSVHCIFIRVSHEPFYEEEISFFELSTRLILVSVYQLNLLPLPIVSRILTDSLHYYSCVLQVLTDFLEKHGFLVEKHFKLETAFRATWGSDAGNRPHVAVLCEYDALPEIGHACGHNLIAELGVAAGLGIKAAMQNVTTPLGKAR